MNKSIKKVTLIILDGFGLTAPGPGNAILQADMSYLNTLIGNYPAFSLIASGLIVGLPWGKFGNSEVGHSAIGTGRILVQDWARINTDIQNGKFFSNKAFQDALAHCRENNSNLHIVGCLSPGGIHSHEEHLFALLNLAIREKFSKVFLHIITDGEDAPANESLKSLERLRPLLGASGAKIATVIGRAYGMDRVLNWGLTEQAWQAMALGKGIATENAQSYIAASHQKGFFDDEIVPAVVTEHGSPVAVINNNDALLFFNYRNDRMKQLLASFVLGDEFIGFPRERVPSNLFVATMTRYSKKLLVRAIAYDIPQIQNILSDVFSTAGFPQLRIAEKEKEAHVTNFFNGGRLAPNHLEEWSIIESRQLKGRELLEHPQMAATDITDAVLKNFPREIPFTLVNFANADMIAHTGNLVATIKGLRVLDRELKRIISHAIQDPRHITVITCDHGNAEELIDPSTGGPDTQHSVNNVPIIFIGQDLKQQNPQRTLESMATINPIGSLIDVAPSILKLLDLPKPDEMTGTSLI